MRLMFESLVSSHLLNVRAGGVPACINMFLNVSHEHVNGWELLSVEEIVLMASLYGKQPTAIKSVPMLDFACFATSVVFGKT